MGTNPLNTRIDAQAGQSGSLGDVESLFVPDHELVRRIGSGSYGEVWLARNVIGSFRAIKIIRRKTFRDDRPFEREFNGIQRFEPISRTHPGFVSILHVGRNDAAGYFYYIMEVADDVLTGQQISPANYAPKTLISELHERGRLPWDECLPVALALSNALAHLHKSGLVHRDIKPANIIFVNGQPKFADIGLVSEIGESATFVGTDGYVPPEGPGEPLADIYSLGMLLYETSTGKGLRHFPEPPAMLEQGDDPRLKKLLEVILKACHLNPAKRLQSAGLMHAELLKLMDTDRGVVGAMNQPIVSKVAVAIIFQPDLEIDAPLAELLGRELALRQFKVSIDHRLAGGVEWAREVEQMIAEADVVIALLSLTSVQSEMIAFQLELARDSAQENQGKPRLFAVHINFTAPLPGVLVGACAAGRKFHWHGVQDNDRLLDELVVALGSPAPAESAGTRPRLETVGGAVPLDSAFYLVRRADVEFKAAVARKDSIVLVKGARQMGKTSLLARSLQVARDDDHKVILTDFQKLNAANFETVEKFYLALGESLADQLDLDTFPADSWDARRSPNSNFERYFRREVLDRIVTRLVWGMDEVDRLFPCGFSGEVFGLFRSWHNKRALEPSGPWAKLTLAIAYATEAHLFISDLVQSPFNIGTRLTLEDFAPEQVEEMNRRYGSPLASDADVARFIRLVGGQPFLVRRGLHEITTRQLGMTQFEMQAGHDEGPFGDHLRRILFALVKDPVLLDVVRKILRAEGCPTSEAFYRLRSSGVMTGDSPTTVKPRCDLYAAYLTQHLL